jgi:hypothetical protein
MATVEKDFKVKNGLVVTNGGTFGDSVSVGEPTLDGHATTKLYVDNLVGSSTMTVGSTAPSSPANGQLWLDTVTERVYFFYQTAWLPLATLADAETLQNHIHDTSIDGNGLIVSVIVDAGFYNSAGVLTDAGTYDLTSWNTLWDGGIAIDNFN